MSYPSGIVEKTGQGARGRLPPTTTNRRARSRMSVLIEALTMVVPRRVLDVSYPGGPGAFLQALAGLERPPRFVCEGDPELVAASFHDRRHLEPAYDLLEEYLICSDGKEFVELALVREGQGPPLPCEWLKWKNHEDGFTSA